MKAILALDQGTTSSRAIVFDRAGLPISVAQQEFRQIFPQPGWVEHDPEEIFASQRDVAARALAQAGLAARDVAAIGITNQRETTVLWDRATGRAIANAIVWQDRRTASRCDALRQAGHDAGFRDRTGLVLDAYFSGTKLAWLLDSVPDARRRAENGELAFGTIDSWLAWRLTGGEAHVTDASNASRTLLFNIHDLDWDDELLALLDIPRCLLPRVAGAGEIVGATRCEGLPAGIPIAGMVGELVGAGAAAALANTLHPSEAQVRWMDLGVFSGGLVGVGLSVLLFADSSVDSLTGPALIVESPPARPDVVTTGRARRNRRGDMAREDDVGRVILFLLSPFAGYVNGVLLPVDGGQTLNL